MSSILRQRKPDSTPSPHGGACAWAISPTTTTTTITTGTGTAGPGRMFVRD